MNHRPPHAFRLSAWHILGWVAALAIFAFAVTLTVGHVHASGAGASVAGVTHDPALAVGHRDGTDTSRIRVVRTQPASRTRVWTLAVLAVGVVVAALTRRERLLGGHAVAPAFRLTGLHSARGPPLARIA